jgi:hypothetical protein
MAKFSNKVMGKEVGQASTYAEPHTMKGKQVQNVEANRRIPMNKKQDWQPLDGMSISINKEAKTDGIKIRGTGAATKGVMARGPMG